MLFLQALVFTSTLWLPECQCSKPLFLDDPHVTHTVENKRGPELSCAKPPCKAQSAFQGILQCWVSDHFNQGIPMRNGEWVDYLMVVPSAFCRISLTQVLWVLQHACMLSHFSHVWPFLAPWTVALQATLSMGIHQTRILWVAMTSSRGSSWPGDRTCICIAGRFFTHWPPGKPWIFQGHFQFLAKCNIAVSIVIIEELSLGSF